MFIKNLPLLKIFGGIGTIITTFFGINSLKDWYGEKYVHVVEGRWELYNTIEETTYPKYKGLEIGYVLFIEQEGKVISGDGEKTYENERLLPSKARTPIKVSGTIDGKELTLKVTEKGDRDIHGMIKLKVTDIKTELKGSFSTAAANSSGKCEVKIKP